MDIIEWERKEEKRKEKRREWGTCGGLVWVGEKNCWRVEWKYRTGEMEETKGSEWMRMCKITWHCYCARKINSERYVYTAKEKTFTEGELGQVDEALAAAVRRVVGQGLHHVVSFESSFLHRCLHHGYSLHTGLGVKVAVHSYDVGTWGQERGQEGESERNIN